MKHEVRRRTAQLDFKTRHLEEAITALRLMLKAREEDRHELGQEGHIQCQTSGAALYRKAERQFPDRLPIRMAAHPQRERG